MGHYLHPFETSPYRLRPDPSSSNSLQPFSSELTKISAYMIKCSKYGSVILSNFYWTRGFEAPLTFMCTVK